MIILNNNVYSTEYVEKAIEAFSQTKEGYRDDYQDDERAICLLYKSNLGDVLITPNGGEYHSVSITLISTPEQQKLLKAKPDPLNLEYRFLPIAQFDFPEPEADLLPVEGKAANCPQAYFYAEFEEDASHAIFMDGDGLLIREV